MTRSRRPPVLTLGLHSCVALPNASCHGVHAPPPLAPCLPALGLHRDMASLRARPHLATPWGRNATSSRKKMRRRQANRGTTWGSLLGKSADEDAKEWKACCLTGHACDLVPYSWWSKIGLKTGRRTAAMRIRPHRACPPCGTGTGAAV